MTTITITRALLEQALEAIDVSRRFVYQDSRPQVDAAFDALSAELAKPEQAEPVAWLYSVPGHRSSASCERIPLDMTPRGTAEAPLYLHPPTPAWHDAPETIALKAERDELLKLINRRKIHPHDFPLEIFIADLSTRTANVLRAEFDSFRHTDGTYDIEPPFTVRHLLMFSRQEIKKWPGIGKKGLNEIEENLRVRGLQLWHAHDDRSLRLLREHKSYFVDPAKAKGVAA